RLRSFRSLISPLRNGAAEAKVCSAGKPSTFRTESTRSWRVWSSSGSWCTLTSSHIQLIVSGRIFRLTVARPPPQSASPYIWREPRGMPLEVQLKSVPVLLSWTDEITAWVIPSSCRHKKSPAKRIIRRASRRAVSGAGRGHLSAVSLAGSLAFQLGSVSFRGSLIQAREHPASARPTQQCTDDGAERGVSVTPVLKLNPPSP